MNRPRPPQSPLQQSGVTGKSPRPLRPYTPATNSSQNSGVVIPRPPSAGKDSQSSSKPLDVDQALLDFNFAPETPGEERRQRSTSQLVAAAEAIRPSSCPPSTRVSFDGPLTESVRAPNPRPRTSRRSISRQHTEPPPNPHRLQGQSVYHAVLSFERLKPEEYMRRVLADVGPLKAPMTEGQYQAYWRCFQAVDERDGTGDVSLARLDRYLRESQRANPFPKGRSVDLLKLRARNMKEGQTDGKASIVEVIVFASPELDADHVAADLKRLADLGRLVRTGYRAPRPSLWKVSLRRVSAHVRMSRASLGSVCQSDMSGPLSKRQVSATLERRLTRLSTVEDDAQLAAARRAAQSALSAILQTDAGLPPGAELPPERVPTAGEAARQLEPLLTAVDVLRPAAARERLGCGDGPLARLLLLAGARHLALGESVAASELFDEAKALKGVPKPLLLRSIASAGAAASARGLRSNAMAAWEDVVTRLHSDAKSQQGGLSAADEVLLHHCQLCLAKELLSRGDVAGAKERYEVARTFAEREPGEAVYHSAGAWRAEASWQAGDGLAQILEKEGDTLPALRCCRQLQDDAKDEADPQKAASLHSRAGRLYARHGMLKTATDEYELAIESAKEGHLGVQLELGLRLGLGDTLKKRKRLKEAKVQYECAIGLARQLQDVQSQGWALLRGGLCSQQLQVSLERQRSRAEADWEGQRAFAALSQADGLFESVSASPLLRSRVNRALAELLARSGNVLQAAEHHEKEADLLGEAGNELGARKAREAAERLQRSVEQASPFRRRPRKKAG